MAIYWKSIFDYLDADFLLVKLKEKLIGWLLSTTQYAPGMLPLTIY